MPAKQNCLGGSNVAGLRPFGTVAFFKGDGLAFAQTVKPIIGYFTGVEKEIFLLPLHLDEAVAILENLDGSL